MGKMNLWCSCVLPSKHLAIPLILSTRIYVVRQWKNHTQLDRWFLVRKKACASRQKLFSTLAFKWMLFGASGLCHPVIVLFLYLPIANVMGGGTSKRTNCLGPTKGLKMALEAPASNGGKGGGQLLACTLSRLSGARPGWTGQSHPFMVGSAVQL